MAVVSWGAPTLQFYPLSSVAPVAPTTKWDNEEGVIIIPGNVLLENSTTLNTTEGEEFTIKNEFGLDVDKKKKPSSYALTTSIIKTKSYEPYFVSSNGIVTTNYAMRLIPEDSSTFGFEMGKVGIATAKGWDAAQGAIEILTINGLEPDGVDKEICKDLIPSTLLPPSPSEQ